MDSGDNDTGWQISIDIDKMVCQGNTSPLPSINLKVPELNADLEGTDINDIESEDERMKKLFQVEVMSQHYATPALRNMAVNAATNAPETPPKDFDPEDLDENDEQPTITLTRRTQGKLTLSKDEVTAGSKEDFDITYKADPNIGLAKGEVIEIRLPDGWGEPKVYQLDDDKPTSAERDASDASDASYVYLTESSRLDGTVISLIDKDGNSAYFDDGERDTGVTALDGWFVQIALGKDVSRNSTVVLNYNDVTVQRGLTSEPDKLALIEAFSGPVVDVDLPQFPVEEQKKIKVVLAADGSGEVTFAFNGLTVAPLGDGSTV